MSTKICKYCQTNPIVRKVFPSGSKEPMALFKKRYWCEDCSSAHRSATIKFKAKQPKVEKSIFEKFKSGATLIDRWLTGQTA